MYILFIDACPTTLAKNLLPIANYFKKRDKDIRVSFVSLEFASYISKEMEIESVRRITEDSSYKFIKFRSLGRKAIAKFLEKEKPDIIFTDGYRIYDQLWIGIGRQLQIPAFKMQHGFEIDSVYFQPIALISKMTKILRILYGLYGIAHITESSYVRLLQNYIGNLFYDQSFANTALYSSLLHPEKTFVYSKYYMDFWNEKYGINKESMVLVTPIDFLLIPKIMNSNRQNACCYITQTLVEDGRMGKKEFLALLKSYRGVAKRTKKFIIKLHPRCNLEYYKKEFQGINNIEFTREFPNCTSYITHYSSMAFTAAFFSNTIIIHELEGHPTPKIFRNIASHIASSVGEIITILDEDASDSIPDFEDRKKQIDEYAVYEDIDSYEKIYSTIQLR